MKCFAELALKRIDIGSEWRDPICAERFIDEELLVACHMRRREEDRRCVVGRMEGRWVHGEYNWRMHREKHSLPRFYRHFQDSDHARNMRMLQRS